MGKGAIALLSNFRCGPDYLPIDPSSTTWLGEKVQKPFVSRSGLWNRDGVNRVFGDCDWLDELEVLIGESS
jgi:hypothetical protein